MNVKTKIMTSVTALTMVAMIGTSAIALAAESDSTSTPKETRSAHFQSMINELVTDGSITQAQADEVNLTMGDKENGMDSLPDTVKEALKAKMEAERAENDPFADMSEDQKTAISEKMQSAIKASLAELVSDGTITQDQADKLSEGRGGFGKGYGPRDVSLDKTEGEVTE